MKPPKMRALRRFRDMAPAGATRILRVPGTPQTQLPRAGPRPLGPFCVHVCSLGDHSTPLGSPLKSRAVYPVPSELCVCLETIYTEHVQYQTLYFPLTLPSPLKKKSRSVPAFAIPVKDSPVYQVCSALWRPGNPFLPDAHTPHCSSNQPAEYVWNLRVSPRASPGPLHKWL